MNAEILNIESRRVGDRAEPQLRTLVVCDIADSTALVERMGDQSAANIIRKHDRLARALVEQHRGREIDKTDGFLLLFDRPIQAVAFALDYQRGLKHLSAAEGVILRARVGIHMGDVVIWENAPEDVSRGAKPIEVEGLVKPVAARLAQLALPQQTLVSFAAAGIARRAQRELGHEARRVHWKEHGRYRFKGLPEPMEVIEVGEEEIAPLRAPGSGRTAKKILPWYRRPLTLAAEAAMLAIGIGFGTWFLLQSPPTLAFAKRDWVVVGDLHNLTGDPRFNQSVETALHISLEQSQYVNVLPELSVQQTLQRMERNPDKTPVTRAIGSEIALRDGARALILPTLAEVGGRVRVTAEVVDPNTQTTVYSVSADGVGAQSVLPSLDSVSKQLRGKLGEALAMVSKESQPLDKVATSNLDALRAYALGERAYGKGAMKDAVGYQQQALRLDPNFALAHIALLRTYVSEGDNAAGAKEADAAARLADRLSAKDKLYVDAWKATFTTPQSALEKWKLLTNLYPDFFPALGTYSFFAWRYANNYELAISAAQASASSKNPHRAISQFFLGNLYLGQERYKDSLREYRAAIDSGIRQSEYFAAAYAATRNYKNADNLLSIAKPSGVPSGDLDGEIMSLAIALDEGNWGHAFSLLRSSKSLAQAEGPRSETQFGAIELSLLPIYEPTDLSSHIADYAQLMQHAMAAENSINHGDNEFRLALAAYIAARAGDLKESKATLEALSGMARDDDYPAVINMRKVAEAGLLTAQGQSDKAIHLLGPLVDGTELYVTHVALLDAYRTRKDLASASHEATWLATHRGRAYSEYSVQWILNPFNVVQSDLALLTLSEVALQQGNKADAQKQLKTFLKVWPTAEKLPALAPRLHALAVALH